MMTLEGLGLQAVARKGRWWLIDPRTGSCVYQGRTLAALRVFCANPKIQARYAAQSK